MTYTQKIARNILDYYSANRAVGHTYAALNGFRNTDNALYMAATHSQTKSFGIPNDRSVTLQTVHDGRLVGHREPLLIDHHTVWLILYGLLEDIEKLEAQVKKLSETAEEISDSIAWLKDASYEYQTKPRLLIVRIPNSATKKEFKFRNKSEIDLVMCLLDTIFTLEKDEPKVSIDDSGNLRAERDLAGGEEIEVEMSLGQFEAWKKKKQ